MISEVVEFVLNVFEGRVFLLFLQYLFVMMVFFFELYWYDCILDILLGEDEMVVKNRIVLICVKCWFVNGQVLLGMKLLVEIGKWKCMVCGVINGEIDEGKCIVQEVFGGRGIKVDFIVGIIDDEGGQSFSEIVEVEWDLFIEFQELFVRKRVKRGQW